MTWRRAFDAVWRALRVGEVGHGLGASVIGLAVTHVVAAWLRLAVSRAFFRGHPCAARARPVTHLNLMGTV